MEVRIAPGMAANAGVGRRVTMGEAAEAARAGDPQPMAAFLAQATYAHALRLLKVPAQAREAVAVLAEGAVFKVEIS